MANLYVYKDNEITQFISNNLLISLKLEEYGIKLNHADFENIEEFTAKVLATTAYTNWDIFRSNTPITSRDLHYHMYLQARLMVKGIGRFCFEIDDELLELDVGPGDFISFPAKVIHYFNTLEPTLAIRFFSTDDGDDDRFDAESTYD
jgi:cupin superfamily acireductone dioxygenase involved in methionine salvage